jgi:hypothetical protein
MAFSFHYLLWLSRDYKYPPYLCSSWCLVPITSRALGLIIPHRDVFGHSRHLWRITRGGEEEGGKAILHASQPWPAPMSRAVGVECRTVPPKHFSLPFLVGHSPPLDKPPNLASCSNMTDTNPTLY